MRIGVVVQRYGVDVNGGAELLCRTTCEHLAQNPRVERLTVLTTCARDHITWANHYPQGRTIEAGVEVERFATAFDRLVSVQDRLSRFVLKTRLLPGLEPPWFVAQGPIAPGLLRRLVASSRTNEFDAYLFFTYLYAHTVFGLPLVARRAVLAPTAHDERPIHMNTFKLLFQMPRGFAFLTPEEQTFVHSTFPASRSVPSAVVGTGITMPEGPPPAIERMPDGPFVLYVGRIEPQKGFPEFFEHFDAFKRAHAHETFLDSAGRPFPGHALKLVLAGRASWVEVPARDDVVVLGFVSDDEKRALMARCEVFILPSRYESLSLVLLESWANRRPVMVNAGCEATSGQVRRARGGLVYDGAGGFCEVLSALLRDPERRRTAADEGYAFVQDGYAWPRFEERLLDLVDASVNPQEGRGARREVRP
jgi:glycosyltransferase involved in cell wall biosynthesis